MEREREAAIECSQCGADIRGRRFCIACGAPVISEDATIAGGWTTSTGHETVRGTVPRVSGAPFQSRQEQHAFVTDEAPAVPVPSVGGRGRSRKGPILVGTVLALTLIGAAVLGYLWLDAASNRDAIRTTLATTAADLNVARQANDQLEADLADSKALATRRAALLSQTERVLRAVDPLLSSVDELQGIASEIQTARTSYADASSVLKSDLIALANYLLDLRRSCVRRLELGQLDDLRHQRRDLDRQLLRRLLDGSRRTVRRGNAAVRYARYKPQRIGTCIAEEAQRVIVTETGSLRPGGTAGRACLDCRALLSGGESYCGECGKAVEPLPGTGRRSGWRVPAALLVLLVAVVVGYADLRWRAESEEGIRSVESPA